MKIAILTLAHRMVEADYARSIVKMSRFHGADVTWDMQVGHANVPRGRNVLASRALANGCDSVVFVDSDIGWEPEEFMKLYQVPEGVHIVAGAPQRRTEENLSWCGTPDPGQCKRVDLEDGNFLISGFAATAFLRIDRCVFEAMGAPEFDYQDTKCRAWFDYEVGPNPHNGIGFIGEDFYFSRKAKEAGHEVWIRPDIKLRHWHSVPLQESMSTVLCTEAV